MAVLPSGRRIDWRDAGAVERLADRVADLTLEEAVWLTDWLAVSGACLPLDPRARDLASTGGPGSLSTLLGPLMLVSLGCIVPTLGVPGRPAGGIDVLASLPGFKPDLDREAVLRALDANGHVHLLAGATWAPADLVLFAARQRRGLAAAPLAIAASLIAKKLATGVTRFGLDIRVGHGLNFGGDAQQAEQNVALLRELGMRVGIDVIPHLAVLARDSQPYIGRGEALLALDDVFNNSAGPWLLRHVDQCWAAACATARRHATKPSGAQLRQIFNNLLLTHGSLPSAFDERVHAVRRAPRRIVRAARAGTVHFDLLAVRDMLVASQRREGTPFADPAGITLLECEGTRVQAGQALMSVRESCAGQNVEHPLPASDAVSVRHDA
jgi:thymidine phosphorylase